MADSCNPDISDPYKTDISDLLRASGISLDVGFLCCSDTNPFIQHLS